jgi:guanylate kinase
MIFILSGPSAVGKDAVFSHLKRKAPFLNFVVTTTTRERREGEKEGVDYNFVSPSTFERLTDEGEFLEWSCVYGNFYGVPKRKVEEANKRGEDIMLKVDTQGAEKLKKMFPSACTIFLLPPSVEELQRRIEKRGEIPDKELRMEKAREEMASYHSFDHVLINREVGKTAEDIINIIQDAKG